MIMRWILLVGLAVLLLLGGAAPAAASRWHDGPFSPTAKVVDHTVVLKADRDVLRTIRRRGHWARITETAADHGKDTWLNLASRTSAVRIVNAQGEQIEVRKERDDLYTDTFDLDPKPTGRTDRLLGEACRVWEVWRSRRTDTRHESCVTDDGIELWYRTTSDGRVRDQARAVSVARGRLRDADVRPRADLLSRDRFLAAARRLGRGYVSPVPDHIVRFGERPGAVEERRSGAWTGKLAGLPKVRTLELRDDASGAFLNLSRDYRTGSLSELRLFLPRVAVTSGRPVIPDRNGPVSIVAGERCWPPPEPVPGPDVLIIHGYKSCLAADGILLSWFHAGRIATGAVASSVVRRKVRFDEVFPRDTPLSNRAWGLAG